MTMLCGGNVDDVVQSPAMTAALEVSGAVKTAASAAVLRRKRRQRPACSDGSGGCCASGNDSGTLRAAT
eukprot:4005429-Pleurochrysis_carterae.AAC.1